MLRRLSMRGGIWFRCLNSIERGIVDLTIKLIEKIRSPLLFAALKEIMAKICHSLKAGYLFRYELVGRPLAEGLSQVAYSWGNKKALLWKEDLNYVRLLGINALSSGFRI